MTDQATAPDRPLPFVVLFQGRTGSTFFVEALDSHPDVRARYERLASDRWANQGAAAQLGFARRQLTDPEFDNVRALGFKTKLRDVLDPSGLAHILRDLGAHVIHLKRRNLVKVAVSTFNSERVHANTGKWNLYERDPRLAEPLAIDPDWFAKGLRQKEEYERALDRFVAEAARPTLTLFYEDLLLDTQGTIDLAFRFLGVEPIHARGMTVKATPDDLRDVLANFDELRDAFVGTRYEPMFDEVLVPRERAVIE